jgi:hypothetical protein
MTGILIWGGLLLIALIVNYRFWTVFSDREDR